MSGDNGEMSLQQPVDVDQKHPSEMPEMQSKAKPEAALVQDEKGFSPAEEELVVEKKKKKKKKKESFQDLMKNMRTSKKTDEEIRSEHRAKLDKELGEQKIGASFEKVAKI